MKSDNEHRQLKKNIENSCNAINELLNKINKGDTVSDLKVGSYEDLVSQVQAELAVRIPANDKNKKSKYGAFILLANTKDKLDAELNKIKEKHNNLYQQINKLKNPPNLEGIIFDFFREKISAISNTQNFIKKIKEKISNLENVNSSDGNTNTNESIKILNKILKNINKIEPLDKINSSLQPAIDRYSTYMRSVKTAGSAEETASVGQLTEQPTQGMATKSEETASVGQLTEQLAQGMATKSEGSSLSPEPEPKRAPAKTSTNLTTNVRGNASNGPRGWEDFL